MWKTVVDFRKNRNTKNIMVSTAVRTDRPTNAVATCCVSAKERTKKHSNLEFSTQKFTVDGNLRIWNSPEMVWTESKGSQSAVFGNCRPFPRVGTLATIPDGQRSPNLNHRPILKRRDWNDWKLKAERGSCARARCQCTTHRAWRMQPHWWSHSILWILPRERQSPLNF